MDLSIFIGLAGRPGRRPRAALTLLLAAAWGLAAANTPRNITPGEVARLPEYCADAQSFARQGIPDAPSPIQQQWLAAMGKTFWHMHHYCWALIGANRSELAGTPAAVRNGLLNSAVGDVNYVIERAPADFPLLPELLLRAGQYSAKAGKLIEAFDYLNRSIEVKPDYWPPYLELSSLHMSLGKRQEAVKVLESGLQLMPAELHLTEALARIQALRPAGGVPPRHRRAASAP